MKTKESQIVIANQLTAQRGLVHVIDKDLNIHIKKRFEGQVIFETKLIKEDAKVKKFVKVSDSTIE